MDKVGKKYWENTWAVTEITGAIDSQNKSIINYVNQRFHKYFCNIFNGLETCKMRLLEIGCARSSWLPYFAKEFGFEVVGIDYSETGCRQAEQILAKENEKGEIVCADLFSPPEYMLDAFDIVVSFGVAEHFADTSLCIAAFTRFLKPGGLMITNIPNMVGLVGGIEKIINRPVFDIHVQVDKNALKDAHESCGLQVLSCDYFMFINFGVLNLEGVSHNSVGWFLKKGVVMILSRISIFFWFLELKIGFLKSNKFTSPYINCLARVPFEERS